MRILTLVRIAAIMVCATWFQPVVAEERKSVESALEKIGTQAIRMANSDLCYPNTSEEYEALGKNGVIRIQASSAISTELPLRSVYLEVKGLRIPLRRIVVQDKVEDRNPNTFGTRYWRQVSFYIVPLNILRTGPRLMVDFTGQRTGFSVTTYSVGGGGPAFARLDEYNTPSEVDTDALAKLLTREYPDGFN